MRLCVFPNDPIRSYYEKGEIKNNYFNPQNIFDEIMVISFTKNDIEEERVKELAGTAKFKIYSIGKVNLFNKSKQKEKVLKLLKEIKPDVVRAYNPLMEGWIAAKCCNELKIPLYLSLHVQYDGLRKLNKKFKKMLALKFTRKFIEPYVLSNANKITAVYKIIDPYVNELCGKHPEIIYNKIDLKQFNSGEKILEYDKPLILTVGRLTPQKNHDLIIKAIKNLDVYLMIVGDGELKEYLSNLVKKLKIQKKVFFIDSVPNKKIQDYYKSADVFVLAFDPKVEGVPIPVFEALASGIPIIIPNPQKELSDGLEEYVVYSEPSEKAFSKNIKKIIDNRDFSNELSKKGQEKAKEFSTEEIEQKESDIYKELLGVEKFSQ